MKSIPFLVTASLVDKTVGESFHCPLMPEIYMAEIKTLPDDVLIAGTCDNPMLVLGRTEWLQLPGLGIPAIEAKLDTGARTSVLHAESIRKFKRKGVSWVRFICFPTPNIPEHTVICEAPVLDERDVRSSNGVVERRVFIRQTIVCGPLVWEAEINLAARRLMRHRMLVGRTALAGRFLVDPARSHLLGESSLQRTEHISPPSSISEL